MLRVRAASEDFGGGAWSLLKMVSRIPADSANASARVNTSSWQVIKDLTFRHDQDSRRNRHEITCICGYN